MTRSFTSLRLFRTTKGVALQGHGHLLSMSNVWKNTKDAVREIAFVNNPDNALIRRRIRLLGVRYRNVRFHIDVVVGDDLPLTSVLHYDLQQACAEPPLVIRVRSGRQLLNPGDRR